MTDKTFSFATRLRLLREHHRLSKTALAERVGVTTTCVWNWEEGNTLPRSANLAALSEALGAPIGYLRDGADWDGAPAISREVERPDRGVTLPEVIAEAKLRIARMAGIAPENVNISLDY